MIWLAGVLREIAASGMPDYKGLLMQHATDLSEICDRFVPTAPAPEVYAYNGVWCRVGWDENARRHLSLVLRTETGVVKLRMRHDGARSDVDNPNHAVITSAVRSFFDKWGTP